MSEVPHRTGRLVSGDVSIFYRAFGAFSDPVRKTPLIILHGSNYFDSRDWIEVAAGISTERAVIAFDHRGFGESSWSETKDYSLDALLTDIRNVSAHFGWVRPAIMGHSMSGRLGIFFAAKLPDHVSHLIVLDSALGSGNPGKYKVSVGNPREIFPSVEAAMKHLADRQSPPRFSLDRARAEKALVHLDGGYALKRDPDHRNTQSQAQGAPLPKWRNIDVWEAMHDIQCPVTFIRGARSDRNKREYYDRIISEYPAFDIETIDARHDVAYEAPSELIAAVQRILG